MGLAEMIAKAVEEEYAKKQRGRYEKLRNNMITSTEISGICERKFIFSRRNPEIKPDRAGISTLALPRQCPEWMLHHFNGGRSSPKNINYFHYFSHV